MCIPVYKNPNPDLIIFSDPTWLISAEKYLIAHALETVLAEHTSEKTIQQTIDKFVSDFNGIYQINQHDIDQMCNRLRYETPKRHTKQLIEFISIRNTVTSYVTQNFDEIANCLQKSFAFQAANWNPQLYQAVLCAGMEYAVSNIKENKTIIMLTASPAQTECLPVIEMAANRRIKIHILFATSVKPRQQDVHFYKKMADMSGGKFFELRRSFITEMQLEAIFRSIIKPTRLIKRTTRKLHYLSLQN